MLKLSDLTTENIRGTKIHVKTPEESKAFQEAVFELGAKWVCHSRDVMYTNEHFLCVNESLIVYIIGGEQRFKDSVFEELQIDFSNKPDWSDGPEWANWLAQDVDGQWRWFGHEPVIHEGTISCWIIKDGGARAFVKDGVGVRNINWRDTLEQRPDHIPDAGKKVDHIAHDRKMVSSCQNGNNSQDELRSSLAAIALQGMLAHPQRYKPRHEHRHMHWHDAIAHESYELADAMLKAKDRR